MGDQDPGNEPSLELPSLGFGRKRRKKDAAAPATTDTGTTHTGTTDTGATDTGTAAVPEDAPTAPVVEPEPRATPTPAPAPAPAPTAAPPRRVKAKTPRRPRKPRTSREFTLPAVSGPVAAIITGIVVGILAVLLTGLSLRLCEVVKGTTSCGGPGFFLLVAILILLTYVGGWMLRAWRLTDPLSTSFLAVGLMAVVAMLFLIEALLEWWMIIAIPIVSAGTYVLSWWVTTSFVDVD